MRPRRFTTEGVLSGAGEALGSEVLVPAVTKALKDPAVQTELTHALSEIVASEEFGRALRPTLQEATLYVTAGVAAGGLALTLLRRLLKW